MSKKGVLTLALAEGFTKVIGLLLLPLITASLTLEEFGNYSLFLVNYVFFMALFVAILNNFIIVGFFRRGYRVLFDCKPALLFNISAFAFIAVILFSVTFAISKTLYFETFFYAGLASLLAQPSQILLTLKQCEKDYLSYAKISVVYILCYSVFAVLAYLLEIKSWQGFAAIFLIAHALQTLIISFVNARSIKVLFKSNTTSFARYKKHFNTLIGNSVFGWARVNIDKYLIMTFLGSIVLATYSLGFQLGAVIGLLNTILIKVLNPIVFSSFKNGNFANTRKTIIKAVFTFLILTASFVLILPYIVPIFFGEEYSSSIHIAQLICVGYFLQVSVSIIGAVLFYEKKNKLISVLSFVSFCFLVLALAGLIFFDKFNATNTAIMFVLSWLFHFLATLFFSIKEQRFKQLVLDD